MVMTVSRIEMPMRMRGKPVVSCCYISSIVEEIWRLASLRKIQSREEEYVS
jgi:hypothetical protein